MISSQALNALCYILIITAALAILNIHTSNNARQILFKSKYDSMMDKAMLISSTLSGAEYLTDENVRQVVEMLGEGGSARLIVTDVGGWCLYDNITDEDAKKSLILLPEVYTALSGEDVFHCRYAEGQTISTCAVSIMHHDRMIGSVYLMDRETEQSNMIAMLEKSVRRISVILEVAVIVFSIIFSLLFSRRMRIILQSFPRIREGDYGYKIALPGNDELALLAGEFDKLTDKLEEAEQSRRRFVSDASHELKTPLASIKLLADTILQNDLDEATTKEFVCDISSEAERLNRMTQKLLQLSKNDSVEQSPDKEVVILHEVVEKVVRMLQPVADDRDIRLITEIDERYAVLGTEDDFYQIIFNLTENAIKYNVDGGKVTVETKLCEEEITLIVEDTGVGIPEDARPYIFERFYRVDKARSREAGGAGLGLSIVHDMVVRNYGTIKVESGTEGGSRFVLTFPCFEYEEVPE